MDWLTQYEAHTRFMFFIGMLFAMLVLQKRFPRRDIASVKLFNSPPFNARANLKRQCQHLLLTAINTLVLRLVPGAAAVGAAVWAEQQQVGLLHYFAAPTLIATSLSILLLDIAIYFQHRIFHAVPLLWRIHRLHHSDPFFDTTTALRFHPIEILLSMLIKTVLVVAMGAPAAAVIIFEILLNAGALFNHSNLKLPLKLDQNLRLILVTPDMHRIHHSQIHNETNSNFGFSFSFWDRLFGSYKAQPIKGHENMDIGLREFRDARVNELGAMLLQPFSAALSPEKLDAKHHRD